jgi:hypothetical protein
MAIGVAGYHQAEADPPRRHRRSGERGSSFEARAGGIGKDWQEMIESPGGVVTQAINLPPGREQLGPRGVLLGVWIPNLTRKLAMLGPHLLIETSLGVIPALGCCGQKLRLSGSLIPIPLMCESARYARLDNAGQH